MKKIFSVCHFFYCQQFFLSHKIMVYLSGGLVQKITVNIYSLKAIAAIPEGWHLYGANPAMEGLESVQFALRL